VPCSPPLREANLEALAGRVHDVLVVGAGINGAASAAALAGGGASVALVDRGDFGGLTSQESSNLVWGGIKYLENLELALVWKLCRSRNELLRSYPANVREIRFLAPVARAPRARSRARLLAGAWLYWVIGRCATRPPRLLGVERLSREEPAVNAELVRGAVEYSDARLVDGDARFVFGFVRRALDHGAAAANYVEIERCVRDAALWRCAAVDRVGRRRFEVRARLLVNATGPYVDELNAANGVRTRTRHLLSKGIHLVVGRITSADRVLVFFDASDRMFFVIPLGERSLVGTTDTRVAHPATRVTDDDRRFVLENLERWLRRERRLGAGDVIAERCGVRPLAVGAADGAEGKAWTALSRRHAIEVERARCCISVFGGKLTDCLNVGAEVAARAVELGVALPRQRERWYGEPSEDERRRFAAEARRIGLDDGPGDSDGEPLSARWWRRYGADAFGLLDAIGDDPRLAEPVIAGTRCRRVELVHAARREMVVKLEDFLRRRTQIALVRRRDELRRDPGLREACERLAGPRADQLLAEYLGEAAAGDPAPP